VDDVVLVDTDVFSYLWQNRPEGAPFRPLVEGRVVALSFTSVAEAYYGAYRRRWTDQKFRGLENAISPYLILPYDIEMSRRWGQVSADLETAGLPRADNDVWIAVIALHYSIPLVTNNRSHFERSLDSGSSRD